MKIKILLASLFSWVAASCHGEPIYCSEEVLAEKENHILSEFNKTGKHREKLFFVRIFKQFIPLPSSFSYYSDQEGIKLFSNRFFPSLSHEYLGCLGYSASRSDFMAIGNIENCSYCNKEPGFTLDNIEIKAITDFKGLRKVSMSYYSTDAGGTVKDLVILHDDREFVQFSSSNTELWQLSFHGYKSSKVE